MVVTSEGGYTLWDFARLLRGAHLGIGNAMSMDGGKEAQMVVDAGGLHYASYGRDPGGSPAPTALPAVVAVMPR